MIGQSAPLRSPGSSVGHTRTAWANHQRSRSGAVAGFRKKLAADRLTGTRCELIFPIVAMSLHFGEDHGALHDCKAQFNRGLAVLGRKQSMLLPQSAADVYRAGCTAKEGIPHRSMIGRQRESAFYASYSK